MIAGIQQGHRQGLLLTLKYFKLHFYGRSGQKLLEKHPDKYKKVSRIDSKNGFDLTNRNLTFPLHVPLKVKYVYAPRKPLFVDHRKDIDFNILQGNEVLLAFEDLATLTSTEILMGLERLAIQPSQESHNWNEHVWIKAAFEHIKGNQALYKQVWTLRLYNVMKQLNNTDPEMWKLIYGRVEKGIFRMKLKDFIYFWETYHNDSLHFSREFVEGLFKLMEIKLRSFPEAHIIKAMHIMEEHGRITHFYTHNVFLPLFKAPEKKFNAPEMNEILKILMLYNIEVASPPLRSSRGSTRSSTPSC